MAHDATHASRSSQAALAAEIQKGEPTGAPRGLVTVATRAPVGGVTCYTFLPPFQGVRGEQEKKEFRNLEETFGRPQKSIKIPIPQSFAVVEVIGS